MSKSITFERAADYYDQTRSFPPGEEKRAADLLIQSGRLSAEDRILEIGVGTGRIALPLAGRVRRVVGIDLAQAMMARLRAKPGGETILLAQADATRLAFGDGAFDAVVAVHVFHLIPEWQRAVGEVARVLRPGKPLVHAWSENFHKTTWWEAWNKAVPSQQTVGGVQFRQNRTFLTDLGWQPAGAPGHLSYTYSQSPASLLDQFGRRIWSSTWHLTDDELNAGIAAVREAMLAEHGALDTPVQIQTEFMTQAYLPPR